jgi:hypothetical protein
MEAIFVCITTLTPNYQLENQYMATTGYSGTTLIKKLGIKPEMKVLLVNTPPDYFKLLEADISKQVIKSGNADFVHVFAITRKELDKEFQQLIKKISPAAMIWVSWYKKSAKIPTDITEDTIREIVLPTGWVDVKVCAVSDVWSGLKIVKRITPQPPKGGVIKTIEKK